MSDETQANRIDSTELYARIRNGAVGGITLGDLRKLVAVAEGMPDKADVSIEEIYKHYTFVDAFRAKTIIVRHSENIR